VSYLGQSAHNYPKGIISRLRPRQSHDKIHNNLFLLPLRYLRGLQRSSGSLMLGFISLTGVTKGNILDNVHLHSVSPIGCLVIMVHLIPSWMNGISGLVSLLKYLMLQSLGIMHTNPSFVSQHPWLSFVNPGDFSSLVSRFIFLIFSSFS
jgi:hypothetical protein